MDCLVIKVRDSGRVINRAFYFALGLNIEGHKELLGMWISPNEGAKFWLSVLTEIQNRGVKDIFIACVDGLTGFPNAINPGAIMYCADGKKFCGFCLLATAQASLCRPKGDLFGCD